MKNNLAQFSARQTDRFVHIGNSQNSPMEPRQYLPKGEIIAR